MTARPYLLLDQSMVFGSLFEMIDPLRPIVIFKQKETVQAKEKEKIEKDE